MFTKPAPPSPSLRRNDMSGRQSSQVDEALRLIAGGLSAYAAARRMGIAESTIYRAVKRHGVKLPRRVASSR